MTLRGRRIAFDYGDSRIGVAVSDPDGILATPLPYIRNTPAREKLLKDLFAEYAPIAIFVGRPIHLSGEESESSFKVDLFIAEVEKHSEISVTKIDERFTTIEAARKLRDAGKSAKDQRELIDSMSAVAILEAGLAHR